MLGQLRHVWAPGSFVVSFKLETDESILVKKASVRSHVVIGSLHLDGGWPAALFAVPL